MKPAEHASAAASSRASGAVVGTYATANLAFFLGGAIGFRIAERARLGYSLGAFQSGSGTGSIVLSRLLPLSLYTTSL
jgi:hypothetical protein